jgi:hypothetical protein
VSNLSEWPKAWDEAELPAEVRSWPTSKLLDKLLDEGDAITEALERTPRWRWLKRKRLNDRMIANAYLVQRVEWEGR